MASVSLDPGCLLPFSAGGRWGELRPLEHISRLLSVIVPSKIWSGLKHAGLSHLCSPHGGPVPKSQKKGEPVTEHGAAGRVHTNSAVSLGAFSKRPYPAIIVVAFGYLADKLTILRVRVVMAHEVLLRLCGLGRPSFPRRDDLRILAQGGGV